MVDKDYQAFFNLILKFKEEQEKQKQSGLNDYNILNVVRDEYSEVGLHSKVLYSLLEPKGLHYQNDLFLSLFIKEVLQIEDFGDMSSVIVEREESTQESKRIDLTIKNSSYYIGIEIKLNASDGQNQLCDYQKDLQEKANSDSGQKVIIYYLTLNGKDATQESSQGIEYQKVSFKNHILTWVTKCQFAVRAITNLNQAFENYKWIVQKITKNYRSQVMSFKEYLELNPSKLNIGSILDEIDAIQEDVLKNFIEKLYCRLVSEGYECKHRYGSDFIDLSVCDNFLRLIKINNCIKFQIGKNRDPDFKKEANTDRKTALLKDLRGVDKHFSEDGKNFYGQLTYKKINYQNEKDLHEEIPKMVRDIIEVLKHYLHNNRILTDEEMANLLVGESEKEYQ